jgi:hypothetical protein
MKFIRKLSIFALIGLFLYIIGLAYINSHEFIHQQIFVHYGIPFTSNINKLTLSGITIPDNVEFLKNCNEFCKYQNVLNDIFGYYLVVLIFSIWGMFITYLLFRRTYDKK